MPEDNDSVLDEARSIFREVLRSRVYEIARRTPLEKATKLSSRFNHQIYLKREDVQDVFSFKIRGAYNRIRQLTESEKEKGVICVSAGNHGQGVALSAKTFGIQATVVMPVTTPPIKIQAVKNFGAKVILEGDSYTEACAHCMELVERDGLVLIHPFDHPLVIAGQGTIGKEILEDLPDPDYIFVPVGGGGLIAGIACYVKELYPHVKIIGVEPYESDGMSRSVECGERVILQQTGTFADGVSVKQVGEITYRLSAKLVDAFIRVNNDEICSAIAHIYEETRAITEPAGALAVAGIKKFLSQNPSLKESKIVGVNSGANMNFQRLHFVAERASMGDGRESLLAIKLKEEPGSLLKLCEDVISDQSITEFNYRYRDPDEAYILVGLEDRHHKGLRTLCDRLSEHQYQFTDLTSNELVKVHIRHMVGGRGHGSPDELVYRFHFPDRPLALTEFLRTLGNRWNISLFHHRSHGTDFKRVLIGMQVPMDERNEFHGFLSEQKYDYTDETRNPAYHLFL